MNRTILRHVRYRYRVFPSLARVRCIHLNNNNITNSSLLQATRHANIPMNKNMISTEKLSKPSSGSGSGSGSGKTSVLPHKDEKDESSDLIKTLSEQLILETNLNLHKPTDATNQLDTMAIFESLTRDHRLHFTRAQSLCVIDVITDLLNEEFYKDYNDKFLRDFEIDKQVHLFNSLQSEIQYIIGNSRDSELNSHHLKSMVLQRDLDTIVDEINEIIIDKYVKDCKLEFNEHKNENTLLYKLINLNLNDCKNKITIKILSGIKSEIENLRWQTTRSGLLAIIVLASLFLTSVNISNKKAKIGTKIDNESDKAKDIDIII